MRNLKTAAEAGLLGTEVPNGVQGQDETGVGHAKFVHIFYVLL